MNLKELIEILDERVELVVYDRDDLRTMHLWDKDYLYQWCEEFLKKNVIHIDPCEKYKDRLKVYLEDCDAENDEEI